MYEGIFHTLKVDGGDAHVVLKYAKVVRDPAITAEGLQAIAKKPEAVKVIHSADIAGLLAKDVRMSPEDLGAEQYDIGFETDAAISRGRGGCVARVCVRACVCGACVWVLGFVLAPQQRSRPATRTTLACGHLCTPPPPRTHTTTTNTCRRPLLPPPPDLLLPRARNTHVHTRTA